MNIFFPIEWFASWITYSVLGLNSSEKLSGAVNFFLYDTIKIFLLLSFIIYFASIIRSYLPPQKVRGILAKKNPYLGHLLASLLGIITPFCSCSAIPLFLGFVEVGVPLGVTFSFLVASPMINEVALVLLTGMFGIKIALIYILLGILIAVFSGIIIGKLKVKHLLKKVVLKEKNDFFDNETDLEWSDRTDYARRYTLNIIKKIWVYVLIGVGLGAWIHGYIPADFLAHYAGKENWYSVIVATLLGIPLYSNAAGIIPLIGSLTEKGVAIGTSLAFMMAVTGLSLPEFMILKRIMKTKLILIFAGIVGMGIIFTGYLFNFILG